MINRVLIRRKVVQLLYSSLLVENQFTLESQPESPTREKRYAYGLYLDMLYLMVRVADSVSQRGLGHPLADTRFIRRIKADDRIRSLGVKYRAGGFPFEEACTPLADAVKDSAIYKNFLKREDYGSPAAEVVWRDIFNHILISSPQLAAIYPSLENYSMRGVDRMREMMEKTFSNFFAAGDPLPDALRSLGRSMDDARELYFRLLRLPVDITRVRSDEISDAREKYVPTAEDVNPNLRFVENSFVEKLDNDERISEYFESHGDARWYPDDIMLLRRLLKAVTASDIYKEYMEFPATDFRMDCTLWRDLFKNVILDNPDLLESLEEKSVFWNDDLDIIGDFVIKTFRKIAEGEEEPVFDKYKDDEDASFGKELFCAVVSHKDELRTLIDDAVDKNIWETERLAYMDTVVIMAAVAEMLYFPKVPLTVSLNEYIEIAKCYSTSKSAQFVNGLLGCIIERLRAEGKLIKN